MTVARLLWPFVQWAATRSRQVAFDDLLRTEPVSKVFGAERGQSIDRYYIESFLSDNRQHIRGQVLEVASSDYSRKFQSGATEYGVLHVESGHPGTTVVGDLTRPDQLPVAVCDIFICTQTFNFVFENQLEALQKQYGPKGFMVIFASTKNRAVAGQVLHTNFKLSAPHHSLTCLHWSKYDRI